MINSLIMIMAMKNRICCCSQHLTLLCSQSSPAVSAVSESGHLQREGIYV